MSYPRSCLLGHMKCVQIEMYMYKSGVNSSTVADAKVLVGTIEHAGCIHPHKEFWDVTVFFLVNFGGV